jgi:hypothetical protein
VTIVGTTPREQAVDYNDYVTRKAATMNLDGTSITVNPSTGVASAVWGGGGSDSWVPSDQYVDITYGATGDTYTAPADRWVYVSAQYSTSMRISLEG